MGWKSKHYPKNRWNVPKRTWGRWTIIGRHTFNMVYEDMTTNQDKFVHPEAPLVLTEHFSTTAWNAAWWAADITSRGEKNFLDELVKQLKGKDGST